MKVKPVSEYDEETFGPCIFINYGRDENGVIQGEPPGLHWGFGHSEIDFDEKKWTHFIHGDFNFVFSDVDPVNFPEITPRINLDKRAHIDLVTSLSPSWDLIDSGSISDFGELCFGGDWIWNRNSLRKLTNQKLYEFYLRVRKGEYNEIKKRNVPGLDSDEGYLVVYNKDTDDHYESWSPKKAI